MHTSRPITATRPTRAGVCTTILRNAALALVLTGAGATAHAGVKASLIRTFNFIQLSPAEVFVPLDDVATTTLSFNLSSGGKKLLTYSAECAVAAPAPATPQFLELDILVNGVVVAPTVSGSDAFCTTSGLGNGLSKFVRASITVPINVISGANTIRIKAKATSGATAILLGDSALVIHD